MIFSGHGDGFQPDTFLRDDNPSSHITVRELHHNLDWMKNNIFGGEKFGILGFDSCVTSTLEVAYEMADVADFLVASQGFVPNSGWDYGKIISKIKEIKQNELTKKLLTDIFLESFVKSNEDYSLYSERSIDISSCDLTQISNLVGDTNALGKTMNNAMKMNYSVNIIGPIVLNSHFSCQTHLFEQSVDLKDFCENLKSQCDLAITEKNEILAAFTGQEKPRAIVNVEEIRDELQTISDACRELAKKINACAKRYSLGSEFQHSNGISLYFPWAYFSYLMTRDRYICFDFAYENRNPLPQSSRRGDRRLRGNTHSNWVNFLDFYLFRTLRKVNGDPSREFYLFDLDGAKLSGAIKRQLKLNDPKKLKDPKKLNDPKKLVSSASNSMIGDFGRMKNSPWAPTFWQPLEEVASILGLKFKKRKKQE